ncbi:MAG TPA: ATP-binding protein [Cytophagaceae bacterium]
MDELTSISVMNAGTAIFIYSCICFSVSFTQIGNLKKRYYAALGIFPLIELIIYNPLVYSAFYKWLFRGVDLYSPSFDLFFQIEKCIYVVTRLINYSYLLVSVGLIIYYYLKTPEMRYFKLYVLYIILGFTANILAFLSILWWAPKRLVSVSVFTGLTHFLPVSVIIEGKMLFLLPYLSIISSAAMLIALFRYNTDYNQMKLKRELIIQSFDLAEFSIRFFLHSVKNYIMATIVDAEFLQTRFKDDAVATKYVNRILELNQELLDRLSSLNTKFKKIVLHLEPCDLRKIVQDVMDRENLFHLVRCNLVLSAEPVMVLVDTFHFKEVINNIIKNALESMENMEESKRRLTIRVEKYNNRGLVFIQDTGSGIDQKQMENLFKPFYTTKSKENWGLGLSYCYRIVHAHRGKIMVDSKPQKGTVFQILLPTINGKKYEAEEVRIDPNT